MKKFNPEKLIKYRGLARLTQRELGEMIGAKPGLIAKYENCYSNPLKTMQYRLAEALGVDIDDLQTDK